MGAVNVSTESTGQRLGKSDMVEKLDFSVSVAHGTRKSTKLNFSKVPANGGKSTRLRDKNAIITTIEEVRKAGLARVKQSNRKCLDNLLLLIVR